jgi:CBS domain containing-hemolysin-like protein
MKEVYVRDIMIPLSDYATVSENASLLDALHSLEIQRDRFGPAPYRHRAVLVIDAAGQVVGKVSQLDILRALEPNYQKIGSDINLSRFGFSRDFMNAIAKQYELWEHSLESMRSIARKTPVSEIMYSLSDHQKVCDEDSLLVANHQIVMGQHQSLLVTRGKSTEIIGILRSTDAFDALYDLLVTTDKQD